jgi:hypothetical protein
MIILLWEVVPETSDKARLTQPDCPKFKANKASWTQDFRRFRAVHKKATVEKIVNSRKAIGLVKPRIYDSVNRVQILVSRMIPMITKTFNVWLKMMSNFTWRMKTTPNSLEKDTKSLSPAATEWVYQQQNLCNNNVPNQAELWQTNSNPLTLKTSIN